MTARRQGYETTQSDPDITISGLLQLGVMLAAATFSVLISGRTLVAGSMGWIDSDYPLHFTAISTDQSALSLSYSPTYFMQRFLLVSLDNASAILIAGAFLLAGFFALKGLIVAFFVSSVGHGFWISFAASLALLVAMPFPTLGANVPYYLGTLSPNVFHNATQILANALAIPAIYCLTRWFDSPTFRWSVAMGVTGLLSALAKPALTPAWIVVATGLLLFLVVRRKVRSVRVIGISTLSLLLPTATVLVPLAVTRTPGAGAGSSSYIFAPGDNWLAFTSSIPLALLRSWAFPLVVLLSLVFIVGWRAALANLWIPWAVTLVAAALFFFVAQTIDGEIVYRGNLAFGGIAATGALYVMSFMSLRGVKFLWQLPALGILAIQAVGGIFYLNRWLSDGFYY